MEIKDQVEATGARIVIIGSGTPEQARTYAKDFKVDIDIYVDESLETYKAFALERGFFRTLGWRSIKCGFKTMKNGFRQGMNAGDLWQQGGVMVMGPGKQILYRHRDHYAGHPFDKEAVLRACLDQASAPGMSTGVHHAENGRD